MAFVLIDNLPAGTDESDVRALLADVGAEPPQTLELAPGLGQHVAATCMWSEDSYARAVASFMHDMVWHGRTLSANYLPAGPS